MWDLVPKMLKHNPSGTLSSCHAKAGPSGTEMPDRKKGRPEGQPTTEIALWEVRLSPIGGQDEQFTHN